MPAFRAKFGLPLDVQLERAEVSHCPNSIQKEGPCAMRNAPAPRPRSTTAIATPSCQVA